MDSTSDARAAGEETTVTNLIKRLLWLCLTLYVLACAAAVAFALLGLHERDTLGVAFAMLLSMPWTHVIAWLPDGSASAAMVVVIAGMAINTTALWWVVTRICHFLGDQPVPTWRPRASAVRD